MWYKSDRLEIKGKRKRENSREREKWKNSSNISLNEIFFIIHWLIEVKIIIKYVYPYLLIYQPDECSLKIPFILLTFLDIFFNICNII